MGIAEVDRANMVKDIDESVAAIRNLIASQRATNELLASVIERIEAMSQRIDIAGERIDIANQRIRKLEEAVRRG